MHIPSVFVHHLSCRAVVSVVCLSAVLGAMGCDDKGEIRTYHTPKEAPGVLDMTTQPAAAAPTGDEPIHWGMPEGWVQQPGDQFRFATLVDARTQPPLTVTVSRLPARQGSLLANVNRWRGQLSLAPIEEAQIPQDVRVLDGAQLDAVLVDLTSPEVDGAEPSRMLAAVYQTPAWTWFLKVTDSQSTIAARENELLALFGSVHLDSVGGHGPAPTGTPGTTGTPGEPAASGADTSPGGSETGPVGSVVNSVPVISSTPSDEPLRYTVPAGWKADPTPRPARLATLLIGPDPVLAELAITRFPGDVGGELANVNRWRGQLGLPAAADLEGQGGVGTQIDGEPGRVYRIIGPGQGDLQTAILVAFVERDDHIWFFKTVGPLDVLDAHRDRFDSFLASIQLQGS